MNCSHPNVAWIRNKVLFFFFSSLWWFGAGAKNLVDVKKDINKEKETSNTATHISVEVDGDEQLDRNPSTYQTWDGNGKNSKIII